MAGDITRLRKPFLKNALRSLVAPPPSMLRCFLANAMFVLLLARELVMPGADE